MAEDTARAVGAGGAATIIIAGKECQAKPLTLKELTELERECLAAYSKDFVQRFVALAEFLPEKDRAASIAERVDTASKFELRTLPAKEVHDPDKIELTNDLRRWLQDNMDAYLPSDADLSKFESEQHPQVIDRAMRSATSGALDQGLLTDDVYEKLTKKKPKKTRVGYVNWWTTGTPEGRLAVCYKGFRGCGVTREQVAEAIGFRPGVMLSMVRDIEKLSAPAVGNGSDSPNES